MTRDFIFDDSGAVIGYRCRVTTNKPVGGWLEGRTCNRFFPTARGLWQHQHRTHKLHQQLELIQRIPKGQNK